MNHLMIDLETLGTDVDSVFVSIGAVFFDIETGEVGDVFYRKIDWDSSFDCGRSITPNTIKWWLGQDKESIKEILKCGDNIDRVLSDFCLFVYNNTNKAIPWGNGSSFDISMIEHCLKSLNINIPWNFWDIRDVRTIKSLAPKSYLMPDFEGDKHNALDDCKYQIKYVSDIYNLIKR